ncbi:MAG: serine hydrolase [Gaiellaceae bacterium]
MRRWTALALVLVVGLALAPAAAEAGTSSWWERREAAVRYVEGRQGVVSFAFVTPRGKLRDYRKWRPAPSASVLKAMLLVAYLNRSAVRGRALTDSDRSLLAPMIRRSDNATATRVLGIVRERGLDRLAERAGMSHFRLRSPWGLSEITAGDQARFFYRIDRYVARRHRGYARWPLAHVVRSQRWGIPPEVPSGWRVFFKGGWGKGTGRVTHQSALLQDGGRRTSIAVLTEWNPSHAYGTRTIRGIAARLLRTPLPLPAEQRAQGKRSRLSHPGGLRHPLRMA